MEAKLKTALFGYSKKDVCAYIENITAELEKHYSDEISVLVERHSAEISELKKQISRLEAENQKVTDIILEAKQFADTLKSNAEQEAKAIKEKSAAELHVQVKRIAIFRERIDNLSFTIAEFLNNVNADIAKIKKNCDTVVSKYPNLQIIDEE